MVASKFFVKNKLYKYIGPSSYYFTYGKTYKSYGVINDGWNDYNVLQTDKTIKIYTFDDKTNGFGDSYWVNKDIKDYFKLAEHKTHLPSWW